MSLLIVTYLEYDIMIDREILRQAFNVNITENFLLFVKQKLLMSVTKPLRRRSMFMKLIPRYLIMVKVV